MGPGLGDQIPGADASRYVQKPEAIIVRGDKVQRIGAGDIFKQPVQEGEFTAAGVDDQYFIAMAMPQRMMRVEYAHVVLPAPAGADPKKTTDLVAFGVRQAQSMSDVGFFFGPKDFDVLEAVNPKLRLVRVINFGMFDFLAVPLLRALKWIHGYVGNYGWAIIILTFLINAVMFPLRHKSMVSMRKMQEIQPQVKAIQDRYGKLKATDPDAAEDEHGDDESLQGEGREPGQRLRADAADVPGPLRVLLAALAGDRDPRRAVHLVDHGPVGARPVLRDADPDGRQPVLAAADDAARGRRPGRSRR